MNNADLRVLRIAAKSLAFELSAHPFADAIMFDGKFVHRKKAREIERALWPIVYHAKVKAA